VSQLGISSTNPFELAEPVYRVVQPTGASGNHCQDLSVSNFGSKTGLGLVRHTLPKDLLDLLKDFRISDFQIFKINFLHEKNLFFVRIFF
jgi:hypothetical protein